MDKNQPHTATKLRTLCPSLAIMLCCAGMTPLLELYTTLGRTEVIEDELILEESIEGMMMIAGVMFKDSEGKPGTDVTLRMGYYLPGELPYCPCTRAYVPACNRVFLFSTPCMRAHVPACK